MRKIILMILSLLIIACNENEEQNKDSSQTIAQVGTTIDFLDAIAENKIEFIANGKGEGIIDSMILTLKSKIEFSLEIEIKAGVYLKPSDINVQQMVVTRTIKIKLEPKAELSLEIEVACMDIANDAPPNEKLIWTVDFSEELKKLIDCIDNLSINRIQEIYSNYTSDKELLHHNLKQDCIWVKRSSNENDFIENFIKNTRMNEEEAKGLIFKIESLLEECK